MTRKTRPETGAPLRFLRALLAAILLFFPGLSLSGPPLQAQDPGEQGADNRDLPDQAKPLRVLLQSSPEAPSPGALWTVTLLVDHPFPSEVQVQLPPLPPGLTLERMRSEPRLIRKPAGEAEGVAATQGATERWTVVEFQFSLQGAGRIVLGPFEAVVPGGSTLTAPITLMVRGAAETLFRPQLGWQNPPGVLRAGEPAELILAVSGWDPRQPFPEPELFLPETPPDFILEQRAGSPPARAAEGGRGVVLRLTVIPLGEGTFSLPQTRVTLGELNLIVPALRIPVTAPVPAPRTADAGIPFPEGTEGSAAAVTAGTAAAPLPAAMAANVGIPFPDIHPRAFPLLRSASEGIRKRAAALWGQGRRAEALAELRRNERDHPTGPALLPLRREAERALGLEQAQDQDENWRPRSLLAAGLLLSLSLIVLLGLPQVTINFSRVYKGIRIILAINAGICLWGLVDSAGPFLPGSVRYALVRETEARRVPEPEGAVNFRFKEGERALIRRDLSRSSPLSWAFVESSAEGTAGNTGSGWVRIADIIFY